MVERVVYEQKSVCNCFWVSIGKLKATQKTNTELINKNKISRLLFGQQFTDAMCKLWIYCGHNDEKAKKVTTM